MLRCARMGNAGACCFLWACTVAGFPTAQQSPDCRRDIPASCSALASTTHRPLAQPRHAVPSPVVRGRGRGHWGRPGLCTVCPQHLLTAHVDSKDIRGVDDCVAQLKMMDAQGRVWGQDMILQVKGPELLLSDIETKVHGGLPAHLSHLPSSQQGPAPPCSMHSL